MTSSLATFLPIILIVCSNLFYNIVAKATPQGANAFASLSVTYASAATITLVCMVLQTRSNSLDNFKGVNWTAVVLGICITGLELGYILAYRAQWQISVCSLIANIMLAILLVIVGFLFYHEQISLQKIGGMALCLGGLWLLNLK